VIESIDVLSLVLVIGSIDQNRVFDFDNSVLGKPLVRPVRLEEV